MLCDTLSLGGAETHVVTLITELINSRANITLISAGGVYEADLERLGVRCVRAPLDKRDIGSIRRARKIIKKHMRECEIVHAHTRLTAYLAKISRRHSFPKIVVTAHLDFARSGVGRLSYFGDYTLAVSEDIKEHLVRCFGIPEEKIGITRNGIDQSRFRRFGEGEALIITHASRLDRDRADAAFLLTKLAPRLAAAYPTLEIKIAGTGERFEELSSLAEKTNKKIGRRAVVLLGGVREVERVVAASTVFVGVSRAALEAMALGAPTVIAGNDGYGGILCKETVTNLVKTNLCARGFPKSNAEILLRDILSLLESKEARRKLSDMQYELVSSLYSSKKMRDDAYDAYRRVGWHPSVSVLGYFGFGNLGDELTLKYLTEALSARGVTDIYAFTSRAPRAEVGVRQISRTSPHRILTALHRSDALILGGGNLLQNESSTASLLFYSLFVFIARAMGMRIYFLSSGIGALRGRLARWLAGRAVRCADLIGARTEYDRALFSSLGGKEVRLMPDICFLHYRVRDERCNFNSDGYILVIAKSSGDSALSLANELARDICQSIIVCTVFEKEDGVAVRGACRRLGLLYHPVKDGRELIALIRDARLVITERLHGAILSLAESVPAVLSDSSDKHQALLLEIRARCGEDGRLLLSSLDDKKEVGPKRSDFDGILNSLCDEINLSLDEIF